MDLLRHIPLTLRTPSGSDTPGGIRDQISAGPVEALDIYRWQAIHEPHTFITAQLVSRILGEARRAVSLGVDGIKERLLVEHLPDLSITAVDIDRPYMDGCAVSLAHPRLEWGAFDVTTGDYGQFTGADTALLLQMDYQFDDATLAGIFASLAGASVPRVVVLSPSLRGPMPLLEVGAMVKRHLRQRRRPEASYIRTRPRFAAIARPYALYSVEWYSLPFHRIALADVRLGLASTTPLKH
jgi:hypothetical protein